MKKILFLLLLTCAGYAQTTTGQEQDFDYGIRNNVSQLDDNAVFITVQNSDGVQGKSTSSVWAKKIYVDNADVKKSFLSTGLIKNGLVQANADPTKFNITAGIGIISNFDDPENPTSTIVNFPAFIGITPTYLTTSNITYIAINSSATIVQQATPFTNVQRRDYIILGAVIHSNLTTINLINNISAPTNAGTNQLHDLMEAIGALNVDGNKITANGANLSINKTAGDIFKLGVNFANDWKNPHKLNLPLQTLATFRYRTQNGTEGANVTVLNPALYDVANVLTAVPSNKFSIQTVTLFQTGAIRVQYGQATYATLSEAESAINTRTYNVEANIAANGITRAYIILKNTATSLQNASDTKIVEAGKFGNVSGSGGAITLDAIVAALGYTPENVANKSGTLTASSILYPTNNAVIAGTILNQNTSAQFANFNITGTDSYIGTANFYNSSTSLYPAFFKNAATSFNIKGITDQDINIINQGTGMTTISGGWGLGFKADVAGTSNGPDFGVGVAGINYRPPTESMTKNFLLIRAGQYVFEDDNADWQMIITPTGVNIGGGATPVGGAIPVNKFEVDGNAAIGENYDRVYSAPANGLIVEGSSGFGTYTPSTNFITEFASASTLGFPATSGTTQTGGTLRIKNSSSDAVLDIGNNSGAGAWLQSTNRGNLAANYPLLLNPNGGNILMGKTTDDGINKLQVNGGINIPSNKAYSINGGRFVYYDGNIYMGDIDNIGPGSQTIIRSGGANTIVLTSAGVVKINNLSGSGTRVVTADASGGLSASVDLASKADLLSPSFTGTPTAPTAALGTNTTQIATTAFVQANTRPYKVYTALLSQSGTSAPVATVLENTLGGSIVWTRVNPGIYSGTLTGAFTTDKTILLNNNPVGGVFTNIFSSVNTITIQTRNYSNAQTDDGLSNTSIEIRVYN